MTIENTFKDLVDCYFSVNYNEKIDLFDRIINHAGINSNIFKRITFDYRSYDIIVRSLYGIKCEGDNLLDRPMSNLVTILSNNELDDDTVFECSNSYVSLMNTLLRRKEQIDVLSYM